MMFDIFTQDVLNHVYEHWQNDKVFLAAETTIPGSFLFLRAVKNLVLKMPYQPGN